MSHTDFEFDLDDILAEYYAQEAASAPAEPVRESRAAPPPVREERPAPVRRDIPAVTEPTPRPPVSPPSPPPAPVFVGEPEDEPEEAPAEPRPSVFITLARGFFALLFAALGMLVLAWMVVNVHPDSASLSSGAPSAVSGGAQLDLTGRLETYANNAASDALSGLSYIRKHYTIPENAAAPAPDPAKFGSTGDPQEILALIESAAELLDGQEMIFDPNAQFQPGHDIRYYYDETILAVAWRENIDGKLVTCAEIKLMDGSQLRRKLAGDAYGSGVRLYATDMTKAANAVVGINGDFYDYRSLGITAYQRQVYRCNPAKVDSCFFTASGDMLFSYAGEIGSAEEAQRFVDENDVTFAVAFGPVLVDKGEKRTVTSYPIGEITSLHSRTGIGMLGELHYLLMSINMDPEAGFRLPGTLDHLAQFMYDKGCVKAYALDGGQTSVITMQDSTVNRVDYGNERTMSDIIYFASALPSEEVAP